MPRKFGPYEPERLSIEEYNKQIEELEAESERRKGERHQILSHDPEDMTSLEDALRRSQSKSAHHPRSERRIEYHPGDERGVWWLINTESGAVARYHDEEDAFQFLEDTRSGWIPYY